MESLGEHSMECTTPTRFHLFAPEDVIEKRQKLMKSNGAAAKALKKAVDEKDYATSKEE
jgi:hypothetical protein